MSMFGFNVGNFISEIRKSGVAYPHRYELFMGGSRSGEMIFDRPSQEKMNTRLESTTLPASSIGSNPVKLQGIDREMPYGRVYEGDLQLTFLEDKDFTIRNLFEKWQQKVIDNKTFQCGYYDDYVCASAELSVFSLTGEIPSSVAAPSTGSSKVYMATLFDLFPKTINAIDLSTEGGSLIKTVVDLSFRRWETVASDTSNDTQNMGSFLTNPPTI